MILRFAWADQVLTLITGTDLLGINVRDFFYSFIPFIDSMVNTALKFMWYDKSE